jgi:triosephosphate isomerase
MIWVNFKIYKGSWEDSYKLLGLIDKVSKDTGVKIIPVTSPFAPKNSTGVWLQSVDEELEGPFTGHISALEASLNGFGGSLLNHSEKPLSPGKIRQILSAIKKGPKELSLFKLMVCLKSRGQAASWAKSLKPAPDYFAYEPPELIGGEISVSKAKPGVIGDVVEILKDHKVVVGAGIKSADDVKKSLELGAYGVLVSSGVVLSKDPKKVLKDFAGAFSQ